VFSGNYWGVFVNRVLRRIFGPKRDEVYSSPSIIRIIKAPRLYGWDM
jgi:hypothetical protein